jgi:hypothetical protein
MPRNLAQTLVLRRGLIVTVAAIVFLVSGGPASASGAFTVTQHFSTLFLIATSPPAVPAGCPIQLPFAAVSNSGNGVMHFTQNSTGDWFTMTFEGDAIVAPFVGLDSAGNPVLGTPAFSGHLQVWDGGADNLQNRVFHITANFQGTNLANSAMTLDLHANFGATFNANGSITASPTNVTCS